MKLRHSGDKPLKVFYPPEITTFAFDAAERLARAIERKSGVRPLLRCDRGPDDPSDAIMLGDSGYPSQRAALSGLNFGECLICAPQNGLCLCVTRAEEALIEAVDTLSSSLNYDGARIDIPDGLIGRKTAVPGLLRFLPSPDAGTVLAVRKSHDLCDQILLGGMTEESYGKYLEKLSSRGFELIFSRSAEGNLFCRCVSGECSVYAYFTPFNSSVRILCEPAANAHRDEEDGYLDICRPLMTVVGARWSDTASYLNRDAGSGNMGYVFRLEDGSFIIVDGGMELGDYAEKILAHLEEQAPAGEKPRIRCWFVSHTHIDHSGAFLKIAAKYGGRIVLDELCCNFPSISDAEIFREAWNTRRIKESLYRYFPGTKYSKIHTGEVLRFGKTRVEVLWTQDDLVRQYLSLGNVTLNTASLCLRFYIGGNTVLLPADCDETANDIMLKTWGGYLKSDILQVCHHGGWGGTTPFYAAVDPELAIFSTSDELLPMYLQIKYNHDLVYGMHVKEVHNNADRCRVFELPYHPEKTALPPDPAGEILYTKAKQLEALAQIEILRRELKTE